MLALTKRPSNDRGALLVVVLVIMFFLMTMLLGLMLLASFNLARATERIFLLQTQYAAESGADIALTKLNAGTTSAYGYTTEKTILKSGNHYKATYQVKMEDSGSGNANEKVITATGYLYTPANAASPRYTRIIKVTARRSSTDSTSSIVSRNIIQVASSVKEVHGRDVFVNDYIQLDKNVNKLIAENITSAGRKTGAGNCSLTGSGSLVKPSSFSDATQTKTVLKLAYNNCVTPPGNTSNSDFTINNNQTDIQKVESTYIPWSYAMDNSYTSSANGCNDWTSGSPRNLPSIGNDKKTHYPDAGSGIGILDLTCGLTGTLNLGSATYNINDHIHVRANLCDTLTNCNPTFNNTTGSLKFVFVEGNVNFKGLTTAPGSSPIVFVAYGGDPLLLVLNCPLGGAVYLGQSGSNTMNAPAAYFIAANGGVCLDKTKFSASKALGGVSGKNIYIATNSGTPFDLSFDPLFPYNQIPVNLSWKAAQYQRLK